MKKWKNVILSTIFVSAFLLGSSPASLAADPSSAITLEGALLVDGRTMLPLRTIFESIGAGDYIYYQSLFRLHRIKEDGSEKLTYGEEIIPNSSGFIVRGDWIYYSQAADLRKARTDGSEVVQLIPGWFKQQPDGSFVWEGDELYSSFEVFTFSVKGNDLYYLKHKQLHRYDLTTGEIVQLTNEPTDILILGDYIYSSVSTFKDKPKLIKID